MRYFVLIVFLFMTLPASAQNAAARQAAIPAGVLVRDIQMEGFVLQDKDQFIKLFKPYRNKYLTSDDMDTILQKIKDIYELEGYKKLVSITYQVVNKHRLVFTALMTS